jgi:hypothetical protein
MRTSLFLLLSSFSSQVWSIPTSGSVNNDVHTTTQNWVATFIKGGSFDYNTLVWEVSRKEFHVELHN